MIRIDKKKALSELGIPEEMYDELLGDFITQTEVSVKQLEELVPTDNFEEIRKAAHFIKGSAGNLRIEEIHILAKEIEFASKENRDKKAIEVDVARLRILFEELKKIVL